MGLLPFLCITVFVDQLGFGMVLPLLPVYLSSMPVPAHAVSAAVSLYSLMQFLGLPVLGTISDRRGRKPVLLACLAATAAAYALLSLARTPGLVYAAIGMGGLAAGSSSVAQAAAAESSDGQARVRALGLLSIAFGAGITIGPAAGGLLGHTKSWLPVALAAALALLNAGFGSVALKGTAARPRSEPAGGRRLLPVAALVPALRADRLRPLYAAVCLLNIALIVVPTTTAVYASARFGWNAGDTGVLFAVLAALAVAAQALLLPLLHARFSERALVSFALPAAALSAALVAVADRGILLYPLLGVFSVSAGIAIPCLTAQVSGSAAKGRLGEAIAGMNAVVSLAMIAGPLLAGLVAGSLGSAAPWWMAGFASITAAALFIHSQAHRR